MKNINKINMFTISALMIAGLSGLGACGGGLDDVNVGDTVGGGGIGDAIGGDGHTGEPVKGRYDVSGTWDLSSPISANRTLGDALTDIVVLTLADPIPSSSAEEKIDGLLREPIKALVDANAPEALRPDSPLMVALAQLLASVEVTSELDMEDPRRLPRGPTQHRGRLGCPGQQRRVERRDRATRLRTALWRADHMAPRQRARRREPGPGRDLGHARRAIRLWGHRRADPRWSTGPERDHR
jgi:hypothetical protein